jgi:acetoin utilization deacetylase AcuC-like enzyme
MLVTSDGFRGLTERIKSVTPQGKVVACLEGGYNLQALADSVLAICGSMFNFPTRIDDDPINQGVLKDVRDPVEKVITIQSEYWQL